MDFMPEPEDWRILMEFPYYEVSTYGNFRRIGSSKNLATSLAPGGYLKISLQDFNHKRCTKLVKRLVAETYVEREDYRFDTVIVLDNDQMNMHYSNLRWRTRSFAWNYAEQFRIFREDAHQYGPIRNEMTGVEYETIYDCGVAEGLLFRDIQHSVFNYKMIWPSMAVYTSDYTRKMFDPKTNRIL